MVYNHEIIRLCVMTAQKFKQKTISDVDRPWRPTGLYGPNIVIRCMNE